MKTFIALVAFLALPLAANAQPTCATPGGSSMPCQAPAANLQPTDITIGTQATGPDRANETVKMQLQQITAGGFPGSFSSLTTTGNAAVGGTLQVGPTTPITGFGTAIGQALGPLINFSGSGHPGLLMGDRLILGRSGAGGPSDFAVLQVNRTTTFTGGTTATVNGAIVGNVVIGANDSTQEVGVQGLVNTSGAAGGLSVGVWGQVTRAVGGNDPIWGGLFNAKDNDVASSSVSGGQLLGIEVDVNSVRADDGTNVSTWGGTGNRKAMQVSIHRASTDSGTQYEVSNGLWFTTGGVPGSGPGVATDVSYKSAIGFGVNVQAYSALDTRGLIAPTGSSNPVIAVNMSAGQCIDFAGGANLDSAPVDALCFDSGTNKLKFYVAGVAKFSIDTSGNVKSAGTNTASTTP